MPVCPRPQPEHRTWLRPAARHLAPLPPSYISSHAGGVHQRRPAGGGGGGVAGDALPRPRLCRAQGHAGAAARRRAPAAGTGREVPAVPPGALAEQYQRGGGNRHGRGVLGRGAGGGWAGPGRDCAHACVGAGLWRTCAKGDALVEGGVGRGGGYVWARSGECCAERTGWHGTEGELRDVAPWLGSEEGRCMYTPVSRASWPSCTPHPARDSPTPLPPWQASLLEHAKQLAEAAADGVPTSDCVLTVPSYFTPTQRQALLDGAKLAGGLWPGQLRECAGAAGGCSVCLCMWGYAWGDAV